jgi:protein ImuB
MRRVVSLWLPTWPTDRLRRGGGGPSPDDPLVLVGREGGRRIVTAADAAAQRLGLRPGMAAAQAHALVPGLHALDAAPGEDAAALDRLALWALRRYAPVVAADPPDGLMIDATGAAHLHGGEAAMLADMVDRLKASGIFARAAAAPTYGAAHALARCRARPTISVGEDETEAALEKLPVAALRLPAETVTELARLGFDRIGELEAAARAPLALRFGSEPGRRLDQAFGRAAEAIPPIRSPELMTAERAFAEPISAPETLARHIEKLAAELGRMLEARSKGARRLDLLFHRVDGHIEAIRAGTARPVRDPARLARLLCEKLETVDPGFGVERMTLSAPVPEPLLYRPAASSLGAAPEPDVSGLIDTLANRVGHDRLYRMQAVESDVPERSVRRVAPLAAASRRGWPAGWPRPARLLAPPEPIETMALLPDHPPVWFSWRGVRRRVSRADGPERVYGEWARDDAELSAVRDYFQVEDERGERWWVFRAGDGVDPATGPQSWFLHGVFG